MKSTRTTGFRSRAARRQPSRRGTLVDVDSGSRRRAARGNLAANGESHQRQRPSHRARWASCSIRSSSCSTSMDRRRFLEIWARRLKVVMVAQTAGPVASAQGPKVVADFGFEDCPELDLVLVPGGYRNDDRIEQQGLLDWLQGPRGQGRNHDVGLFRLGTAGQGRTCSTAAGRRRTSATSSSPPIRARRSSGCARRAGSTTATASLPRGFRPGSTWPWPSSSGYSANRPPRRLPTAPSISGIATRLTIRFANPAK